MILTLRAVSLNDHPLTQPITVRFDTGGGSIGRADHNTMALPDPKRHISRRQAEVKASGESFSITNVGSANPIVAGTHSLERGETAALAQGDRLRIGGYLLEVDVGADARAAAAAAPPAAASAVPVDPPTPRNAPPWPLRAAPPVSFTDEAMPLSPGNPFAELLGDAESRTVFAGDVPAAAPRLPDDFDPFATPPAPPPAPARPDAGANPFAGLVPGVEPAALDGLFDLAPADGRDRLADFLSDRGPAEAAPASSDPLALLFGAPAARPDDRPTAADHVPELQAAFSPPRLVRDAAARAPVAAAGDPGTALSTAHWRALCEGAGVSVEPPEGAGVEAMREIGALLRTAIDGTLRMMAVRASAKHELRAPVTVIRSQRNNPLKFSPDVNAALEQLLRPPMRGFLPGPAAVEDAMDDLVGHAIGTLAGTRAALAGVLDRFSPGQLESKLAARSLLDNVLPMNRRARLWDLYLQHFETIRGEAQDDFHSLFGRAFLAAYEQQLERLRRGEEPPTPAPRSPG